MGQILVPPVTQLLKVKITQFFSLGALREEIESFWPKKLSHLSWVETKTFKLNKKTFFVLVAQRVTGSLVLLLKLLISKITAIKRIYFEMILKPFDFQCDFDFQITTSKMILILILNHLYLGELILILKSSTYIMMILPISASRFQSDPIERRFGQYREMNGGRLLVSLKDVMTSENILKVKNLVKEGFDISGVK